MPRFACSGNFWFPLLRRGCAVAAVRCVHARVSTRLSWVGSCIVTYDSEWHIFCSRALFARRAFPLSFRDLNGDELTRWSKKKEDEQFKDGRSSCFHRSSFPDMKNHRGGDLESSRTDIFYRSRLPSFVASHFWARVVVFKNYAYQHHVL